MSNIAWLTGTQPDGQAGRWPLKKEKYVIGRREPADLVLHFRRISRQHASIHQDELGYYIMDLNSRNGTFVNGEAIGTTPHRLSSGDRLVLGGVITLRFHDPDETTEGPRLGRLHGIWIDYNARQVWVDARLVQPSLSAAQFTLLSLLYQQAGKMVSRNQIIATVWPNVDPSGVSGEAVDGLIKRMRKRMRKTQPEHEYVKVVRGHGLRLVQPDEEE